MDSYVSIQCCRSCHRQGIVSCIADRSMIFTISVEVRILQRQGMGIRIISGRSIPQHIIPIFGCHPHLVDLKIIGFHPSGIKGDILRNGRVFKVELLTQVVGVGSFQIRIPTGRTPSSRPEFFRFRRIATDVHILRQRNINDSNCPQIVCVPVKLDRAGRFVDNLDFLSAVSDGGTLLYRIPFLFGTVVVNRQRPTTAAAHGKDNGDTLKGLRQIDFAQSGAIEKSLRFYAGNTLRDDNFFQLRAIAKCPIPNIGSCRRDRNGGQIFASFKRILRDSGNTFRKRDSSQTFTFFKSTLSDGFHRGRKLDFFQNFAPMKRIFANALKLASRCKSDLFQRDKCVKRTISDSFYRFRDGNAGYRSGAAITFHTRNLGHTFSAQRLRNRDIPAASGIVHDRCGSVRIDLIGVIAIGFLPIIRRKRCCGQQGQQHGQRQHCADETQLWGVFRLIRHNP